MNRRFESNYCFHFLPFFLLISLCSYVFRWCYFFFRHGFFYFPLLLRQFCRLLFSSHFSFIEFNCTALLFFDFVPFSFFVLFLCLLRRYSRGSICGLNYVIRTYLSVFCSFYIRVRLFFARPPFFMFLTTFIYILFFTFKSCTLKSIFHGMASDKLNRPELKLVSVCVLCVYVYRNSPAYSFIESNRKRERASEAWGDIKPANGDVKTLKYVKVWRTHTHNKLFKPKKTFRAIKAILNMYNSGHNQTILYYVYWEWKK